jgi:hypothetical protein
MASSLEAPLSPLASTSTSALPPTSSKAVNSEPQELDGSPVSHHPPTTTIAGTVVVVGGQRSSSVGEVGQDVVEYEELSGEPGMLGKSSRQAKIAEKENRARDPAVMVNVSYAVSLFSSLLFSSFFPFLSWPLLSGLQSSSWRGSFAD